MSIEKICVGVNTLGYPERRNILVPAPNNVTLKKVNDLMKLVDFFYSKIKKKNHPYFHNVFLDLGFSKVDLFHFFNAVYLGKKPWVVTFENDIPRHNTGNRRLFSTLAGDSCQQIISLSENALNIEKFYLQSFPDLKEKILKKIIVLPPPQTLYCDNKPAKPESSEIIFTFVGGTFFHKGGKELIASFIRLLRTHKAIRLNIVSSFTFTGWYDNEFTDLDSQEIKMLIAQHKEHITLFNKLPNEGVIELLKDSDVAVLPSYGETYGYSVLEAQACGCPVITTNAWAFPEFNSNSSGWLLDLPTEIVNGGLRSDISTREKKKIFSQLLENQLHEVMLSICQEPSIIREKSILAIENIRKRHSVENYRSRLAEIYTKIKKS